MLMHISLAKRLLQPSARSYISPSRLMTQGLYRRSTDYSCMIIRHASSSTSLQGNEEIRAFMDKLTATTNVSKYIDLPMIAVMGDTSSGKSSLLSFLSDVELPSASELTTRCPIMLEMRRSEENKAIVSILWKDIPEGKREKDLKYEPVHVTEKNWNSLPHEIAKAQNHIIKIANKEVARDTVQVQVHRPNCEDLTVVDLPGIVRSHGKGESKNIVGDIKALIVEYLRNPRCVILAIVPANVDFHNSQIMADALEVDPHTKRTIPVITKPDLIDSGAEKDVEELLLGQKTREFLMGFHMVKGRGQKDLHQKMTIEDGIRKENEFFSNVKPWRDVGDKTIFGTTNLRKKLGNLQLTMIRESFPSITAESHEKCETAERELSLLGNIPESDSEKRIFFRRLIDGILKRIQEMLTGKNRTGLNEDFFEHQTFASKLHSDCEQFRNALRSSSFSDTSNKGIGEHVVVTLADGKQLAGKCVGSLTDGRVYIDYDGRSNASTKQDELAFEMRKPDRSSSIDRKTGDVWRDEESCKHDPGLCISNGDGTYDILKPIAAALVRRDPSWILPYIKLNRTDDLPIFLNQEVFRAIIVHFVKSEWYSPSEALVSSTKKLLSSVVKEVLNDTPELAHYPGLRSVISHRLNEVISKIDGRAKTQIQHFFEKERFPYTQDHYLQENLAKLKFAQIFLQLEVALGLNSGSMDSEMSKKSIKAIVAAVVKQNQEKSMDEHMAEDMQHALDAYGKVALKRFIDGVPMQCWNMFRTFPLEAENVFLDFGDDDLRRHVVARDDVRRKVQALEAEEKELKAGLAILESLY